MADRPRLSVPTLPRHEADHDHEEAHTNGTTSRASDPRGKRVMSRTPWLDLPEPWDNLRIRAWLDYPKWVADLWTPVDGESKDDRSRRVTDACKATFLEHDGWEDPETGEVMAQPGSDEFWERLGTPLATAIVTRFFDELQGNPQSRGSRKPKRPR